MGVPREAETIKFLVVSAGVAIAVTAPVWPVRVATCLRLKLDDDDSI